MTDVVTADLLQTLMADGAHNNTWGDVANANFLAIETKMVARNPLGVTGGTIALNNAQELVLLQDLTGALVSNSIIQFSGRKGFWIVNNKTTGAFSVTCMVSGQTGVQIAQNTAAIVYCDGTDIRLGNVVATVTTTQGDLIVRGASADGRLGIGTANQVLQVNAGATSPAWATLSTLLDTLFGSTQNFVLSRGASVWGAGTVSALLDTVLGNAANSVATRGGATWSQSTLTSLLDTLFSNVQGATLFRGASGWAALAPGSVAGYALQTGGAAANPSWQPNSGTPDLIFEHQALSGVGGGNINSNTDTTRPITVKVFDRLGIGSLTANQFQITQAGTYFIKWASKGDRIGGHQSWLYDITNGAEVKSGSSEACNPASDASSYSTGQAYVTITVPTKYEIRHRCQNGQNTFGLGGAASVGHTEVFAYVYVWKTA